MKKLFTEIPFIEGDNITIKKITREDTAAMQELVSSEAVYELEPTFLFEKRYDDINYVIDHLYDEALEESLIMGIYTGDEFCGIAELYSYIDRIHKVSVGIRLREKYWHKGIASSALGLLADYLETETDIEIIQASSLPANTGSANILRKNGFTLVVRDSDEDWGYDHPLPTDKWIR
jgi:RimJ/RimL family protein N-acetyltransferase